MTAKIKLNAASGGGSFSLQAPSSSSNNRVFTLPDSADATLLTSTASLGKFASYAIICDQKNSGTNAGTFTSGDWRTRDLNTEISDEDGIVTISSNQFTLQAGNYFIRFACAMYHCGKHAIRLRNITDSSTAGVGEPHYSYTYSSMLMTTGTCRVSIDSAKVFEVQGYPSTTKDSNGMGFALENVNIHITWVGAHRSLLNHL